MKIEYLLKQFILRPTRIKLISFLSENAPVVKRTANYNSSGSILRSKFKIINSLKPFLTDIQDCRSALLKMQCVSLCLYEFLQSEYDHLQNSG